MSSRSSNCFHSHSFIFGEGISVKRKINLPKRNTTNLRINRMLGILQKQKMQRQIKVTLASFSLDWCSASSEKRFKQMNRFKEAIKVFLLILKPKSQKIPLFYGSGHSLAFKADKRSVKVLLVKFRATSSTGK